MSDVDSERTALPESLEMNGRITVWLVHGTWPNGHWTGYPMRALRFAHNLIKREEEPLRREKVLWYKEGSAFRKYLHSWAEKRRIELCIREHEWSGDNSILARELAAIDLANTINDVKIKAKEELVIIGHSHGGTVASIALKSIRCDYKISLITMGTPFISLRQAGRKSIIYDNLLLAFLLFLMAFAFPVLFQMSAGLQAVVDVASLSLFLLYVTTNAELLKYPDYSLSALRKATAICKASSFQGMQERLSRMMILRTTYDNAGGVLGFSIFIDGVAVDAIGSYPELLVAFSLVPAVGTLLVNFFPPHLLGGASVVYASTIGATIWTVCTLVLILSRKVIALTYGLPFSTNSFDIEISVESVPDFEGRVEVQTLVPSLNRSLNRHSLHESDLVRERIAYFLLSLVK